MNLSKTDFIIFIFHRNSSCEIRKEQHKLGHNIIFFNVWKYWLLKLHAKNLMIKLFLFKSKTSCMAKLCHSHM